MSYHTPILQHSLSVFFPLVVETLSQFRIIFGSVQKHFAQIEKSFGISGSQLWILHEISSSPDIGVSELSLKLHIHQSTCSLLIEKLVKKGLISKIRSEVDQRKICIKLNSSAKKILKNSPKPAEGILPDALSKLNKKQLISLKSLLDQVINNLEIKDIKSATTPLSEISKKSSKY